MTPNSYDKQSHVLPRSLHKHGKSFYIYETLVHVFKYILYNSRVETGTLYLTDVSRERYRYATKAGKSNDWYTYFYAGTTCELEISKYLTCYHDPQLV